MARKRKGKAYQARRTVELVALPLASIDTARDGHRVAFTLESGRRLSMPVHSVYFKPGYVMMPAKFARKIGLIDEGQ